MVRNKCSKTITPTLQTNINNIIASVETHVPSKTTNIIITPPAIPVVQNAPPVPKRKYSIAESSISLSKIEKQDRKMKRFKHCQETLTKLAPSTTRGSLP